MLHQRVQPPAEASGWRVVLAAVLLYLTALWLWRCRWAIWVILWIGVLFPDIGKALAVLAGGAASGIENLFGSDQLLLLATRLRNLYLQLIESRDFIIMPFPFTRRFPSFTPPESLRGDFERQYGPLTTPDWIDDKEEQEFFQFLKASIPGIRFDCPITRDVFVNPVVADDGFTYEAEAIISWIKMHQRSPMTGNQLQSLQLVPNRTLKAMIETQKSIFRAQKKRLMSNNSLTRSPRSTHTLMGRFPNFWEGWTGRGVRR